MVQISQKHIRNHQRSQNPFNINRNCKMLRPNYTWIMFWTYCKQLLGNHANLIDGLHLNHIDQIQVRGQFWLFCGISKLILHHHLTLIHLEQKDQHNINRKQTSNLNKWYNHHDHYQGTKMHIQELPYPLCSLIYDRSLIR